MRAYNSYTTIIVLFLERVVLHLPVLFAVKKKNFSGRYFNKYVYRVRHLCSIIKSVQQMEIHHVEAILKKRNLKNFTNNKRAKISIFIID